jgi:hypothetical protein
MPSTLRPAQLPQVSEVKCRFAVARPEPVLKIAPEAQGLRLKRATSC